MALPDGIRRDPVALPDGIGRGAEAAGVAGWVAAPVLAARAVPLPVAADGRARVDGADGRAGVDAADGRARVDGADALALARGVTGGEVEAAVVGWVRSDGAVAGLNVATESIAPATRQTARMLASSGMIVPRPAGGPASRRSRLRRRLARSSRW